MDFELNEEKRALARPKKDFCLQEVDKKATREDLGTAVAFPAPDVCSYVAVQFIVLST